MLEGVLRGMWGQSNCLFEFSRASTVRSLSNVQDSSEDRRIQTLIHSGSFFLGSPDAAQRNPGMNPMRPALAC